MRVGDLDQQIQLQQNTQVNDAGDLQSQWTTTATVWGKVISQRGSEAFQASRNNATEAIRVQMRYRADVTTDWRLIWQGQNYNITAVDRSQRRLGELWVTAEVNEAL